ncbi:MAG: hypothetical protein Q8L41_08995 [Anaerolineales bacterium]|nr:hypothetical protein [Anaerolineales bacterium]
MKKLLVLVICIMTACAPIQSGVSTVTLTPLPTSTLTLIPTVTPTLTLTSTPVPAKRDLNPVYTETITSELYGVKITTELVTDKSLSSSSITEIQIHNGWNNFAGKNSEDALTEFTARVFYKVWLKNGGLNGTGPSEKVDFETFMQMWADAQNGGLWDAVQITIKVNDLAVAGYELEKMVIYPMWAGPTPEGVKGIDKFIVAFVYANKMENISFFSEESTLGMGTSIDEGDLIIYNGIQSVAVTNTSMSTVVARSLTWIPLWMSQKKPGVDEELLKVIATQRFPNGYSAAIKFVFDNPNSRAGKLENQINYP